MNNVIQGSLTILTGGTGIDNISLAEISFKNSCIIQCQLYLEENIEIDPQATQLFNSILKYLLEPNLYKLSSVITNKSLSKNLKGSLTFQLNIAMFLIVKTYL